jgi:hypothetical protein
MPWWIQNDCGTSGRVRGYPARGYSLLRREEPHLLFTDCCLALVVTLLLLCKSSSLFVGLLCKLVGGACNRL